MQVVVFASQKGGSGKTTLAGHMAVMADAAGLGPVAMLDTDPQGSLAQWWNARRADTPLFVRSSLTELPETLDALESRGIALVCIDTPPAITVAIRSVVENADLVVVPVRPSPHDLRAAGATVDLVEGLERPFVFVVNAASSRARITSDAAIALSQHGTVAPITVHNRTEFAASMSDGRTVMEIHPDGRSAEEMTALWRYIKDRLDRIAARHKDTAAHPRGHAAFSDFVRESYQPGPRELSWGEAVGRDAEDLPSATAPVTATATAKTMATPSPSPAMAAADPFASAPEAPLRVVDEDASAPAASQQDWDEDDGFEDDYETGPAAPSAWSLAQTVPATDPPPHTEAPSRPLGVAPAAPAPQSSRSPRLAMVAQGGRPAPAQGRGSVIKRHAFGRRGRAEG